MTLQEQIKVAQAENALLRKDMAEVVSASEDLHQAVDGLQKTVEELREESSKIQASITEGQTSQNVFTMLTLGVDVPSEEIAKASDIMAQTSGLVSPPDDETWKSKLYYSEGTIATWGEVRYICITSHISQDGWTPYGVPALWQAIKEEYAEWQRPSGSHDAYRIGDLVIFEGKKYECVLDFNVYSPTEYPQGWELIVSVMSDTGANTKE